MSKPIRVFQVATGNVGSEMIKRIATQPDLELVGVHCYSPDKIGRDAGDIAGLAPNGVTATGTIEEIIAAKPDVLTFHGVFPDDLADRGSIRRALFEQVGEVLEHRGCAGAVRRPEVHQVPLHRFDGRAVVRGKSSHPRLVLPPAPLLADHLRDEF